MRILGALVFSALLLWVDAGSAQSPATIDLQALPLPLSPETASVFESARRLESSDFRWALRTSGLKKPLALRLPSPAPSGTAAGLVEGVVLSELSASVGLGAGFDAGFGFGVHLRQSTVNQGSADSLHVESFRGRDPRLGIGWGATWGLWSLRPFAQVHLPVGDSEGFAGEQSARAHLGIAQIFDVAALTWSSQISFLYRETQSISSTTWGPQLFVGTGVLLPIYDPLDFGLQLVAAPVFSRQEGRSGAKGARLIPAELISSFRHKGEPFSVGIGTGFGLPFSRTSGVHVQQKSVLGPTTPVYRAFIDLTFEK